MPRTFGNWNVTCRPSADLQQAALVAAGPRGEILRPKISKRVDYEGELGVLMGAAATK